MQQCPKAAYPGLYLRRTRRGGTPMGNFKEHSFPAMAAEKINIIKEKNNLSFPTPRSHTDTAIPLPTSFPASRRRHGAPRYPLTCRPWGRGTEPRLQGASKTQDLLQNRRQGVSKKGKRKKKKKNETQHAQKKIRQRGKHERTKRQRCLSKERKNKAELSENPHLRLQEALAASVHLSGRSWPLPAAPRQTAGLHLTCARSGGFSRDRVGGLMSSKTGVSSPGSPDMVTGFSGVNAEASSGSRVRSTSPLLIPPVPLAPAPPGGKQLLFKNNIKK